MAVLQLNNKMLVRDYILITGASSGIGKFLSIKLSNKYNVILSGRNREELQKVKEECNSENNHLIWVFDLKNIEDIEHSMHDFIESKKVSIHAFVHCAGFLKMLPLRNTSLTYLQQTMNVNVNAAVLIIKSLITKKVNNAKLQNVVFISSTASIRGAKGFNIYSASKGALDALMRSLAVELAPNVRLNSVLPGSINTKMTESIYDDREIVEKMTKDSPLGLGEVSDIVEMIDFLLSEKSKWVTGQQFVVDGGRTINISA